MEERSNSSKSFMVTAMFSLFLGVIGVDRFYVGKVGTGILKLITIGGFGIWYLIDLILVYTGNMKDKQGRQLVGRKENLKLAVIILIIALAFGIVLPKPQPAQLNTTTPQTTVQPATDANKDVAPPVTEKPAEPSVPTEYKSALNKATTYANTMHLSKAGVYDQLTSEYGEKFSPEAAQYAVDNVKANWNDNALQKAKTYQDSMSMSPAAIYDQLTSSYGEKFTPDEANYAIQNLS